jgi:preprotein translocase subunit SecE
MKSVLTYFSQVKSELSKVVWPSREEVVKLTALIIIISVVVGAYVGALDFVFIKILERIVAI